MKHEYNEVSKAGDNFERLARAVLKAPNVLIAKKKPKVKPTHRETTGKVKGW